MPSKPSAHSKSSNPQPSQLSNCSIQATTIQPTEQARTDQKQHSHLINASTPTKTQKAFTTAGVRLGKKQPRTLQKGGPSSLAVSLTLPRWFRVACPASRRSRAWKGHGSQTRGLSQKGRPWNCFPKGRCQEKRSTVASPGHRMSPPTRPTARPSPTHLPDSGIRVVTDTGPAELPLVPVFERTSG